VIAHGLTSGEPVGPRSIAPASRLAAAVVRLDAIDGNDLLRRKPERIIRVIAKHEVIVLKRLENARRNILEGAGLDPFI
jgi:hypothetical protein